MVCRWVEGRSGRRSKRISLAGFNSDEADDIRGRESLLQWENVFSPFNYYYFSPAPPLLISFVSGKHVTTAGPGRPIGENEEFSC